MTNSPLLRKKINIHIKKAGFGGSKQISFIVTDEVSGIIKLFDIVLLILFRAITFPVNQIFDETAFFLFDNSFIKKSFYLKGFNSIGVVFPKDQ